MGAAAAKIVRDLGANVAVMDYAAVEYETDQIIDMDLREPGSIDHAIDELGGPVDAVFSAAGIADGPDFMRTVFIGHRHLIERLFADDLLPRGAAICFISSVGGMGWENDLPRIQEFLATPDYACADQWVKSQDEGLIHYGFAKQVIGAYVALQAFEFLKRGVRINAICPGPTDTPLARANADLWLSFAQDYRDATGTQVHQPEQMGNAMSSLTNAFPPGKMIMDLITGRVKL
jgi:NAD(P)-dependent dehydrogenase (short-subunit alcohol dehydrogenase family)